MISAVARWPEHAPRFDGIGVSSRGGFPKRAPARRFPKPISRRKMTFHAGFPTRVIFTVICKLLFASTGMHS
jgi:hypothetical protein